MASVARPSIVKLRADGLPRFARSDEISRSQRRPFFPVVKGQSAVSGGILKTRHQAERAQAFQPRSINHCTKAAAKAMPA